MDKLDQMKSDHEEWNRSKFGNINNRLKSLRASIEQLKTLPRTDENVAEQDSVCSQLTE